MNKESLIYQLSDSQKWIEFYNYKKESGHFSKSEEKQFLEFVENKEYLKLTTQLQENGQNFPFDFPDKILINKMATGKKRVVYKFPKIEVYVLKLLCFLLYKYDSKFSDNCYAFRSGRTVKHVCHCLKNSQNIQNKYSVKVDIHDYFNSIPVERLIQKLENFITDDDVLLEFLKRLLIQNKAYVLTHKKKDYSKKRNAQTPALKDEVERELVTENRGAMAGCPLGGFFANLYLRDVDLFFEEFGKQCDKESGCKNSLLYFRYSDDIIIFSDTKELRDKALKLLEEKISEHELLMNPKKYLETEPGEKWDFLGISFYDGNFDLSDSAVEKIKGKIKRKAKKLWSWRNRKNRSFEKAAGILIKRFNRLWFGETGVDQLLVNREVKINREGEEISIDQMEVNREGATFGAGAISGEEGDSVTDENIFNWERWYFPIITTTKSLEEIDHYFQEYVRFLNSGRHYKGNYKISYEDIKKLGYKSLVHEYYQWKKN